MKNKEVFLTDKQKRIKELSEQWVHNKKILNIIRQEFGTCSTDTLYKIVNRIKANTLESHTVKRVETDTWINRDDISSMWIKVPATEDAPWYSALIKMPNWSAINYVSQFWELIESNSIPKVDLPDVSPNESALFVVLSDMHVWLDGRWQYNYVYNLDVLKNNIQKVIWSIYIEYQKHWCFDRIVLLDLWDWLDWWNGQTTRWWHHLQQNMDNVWQFKWYLEVKMMLINTILQNGWCSKLVLRNVTDDNHSWQFWLIANVALEQLTNAMYPWVVDIGNYTQFMQHFHYWDHTFILTHGKDWTHQRYWLPLTLNPKAEWFIKNYIDTNWLTLKKVNVLKWDLHQLAYGHSKSFSYHNFWSFAPPSGWVQANFWDCLSSYSLLVVEKHGNITRSDQFVWYDKSLQEDDHI